MSRRTLWYHSPAFPQQKLDFMDGSPEDPQAQQKLIPSSADRVNGIRSQDSNEGPCLLVQSSVVPFHSRSRIFFVSVCSAVCPLFSGGMHGQKTLETGALPHLGEIFARTVWGPVRDRMFPPGRV